MLAAASRREMGHVFFAFSAAAWNAALSAFGMSAVTSSLIAVTVMPASVFSIVAVAVVSMRSALRLASPSTAESAMEKQLACAAAISSSGLVPGALSNRCAKLYGVSRSTPLSVERVPLPSFRPPCQTADPLRCMMISLWACGCGESGFHLFHDLLTGRHHPQERERPALHDDLAVDQDLELGIVTMN